MPLSGACPRCTQAITIDLDSGRLECPHCDVPFWFVRRGAELAVATTGEMEHAFGFDAEDFSREETIELLRDWHPNGGEEPMHLWDSSDDDLSDANVAHAWDSNPYQPPRSAARKTDSSSETFLLRGCFACDEATLRWATKHFGVQSDVAGLVFFGCLLTFIFIVLLLSALVDDLFSQMRAGWMLWIVIAVLIAIGGRWLPGFVMSPYVRKLYRRCEAEPLFAGDFFWLTLRPSTMTARTQTTGFTWPLREVRGLHNETHLIVLRVAPRRLLYATSNATTIPENFRTFRKAVKKRLHRNRFKKFFDFEIN